MRALVVSDIHSNLEAFQSVISDAEGRGAVDEIWSLGDLVGYGPEPAACIELLRSWPHQAVAGNHDLAAIGKISLEEFNPYAAAANSWTTEQLSQKQADFIEEQSAVVSCFHQSNFLPNRSSESTLFMSEAHRVCP